MIVPDPRIWTPDGSCRAFTLEGTGDTASALPPGITDYILARFRVPVGLVAVIAHYSTDAGIPVIGGAIVSKEDALMFLDALAPAPNPVALRDGMYYAVPTEGAVGDVLTFGFNFAGQFLPYPGLAHGNNADRPLRIALEAGYYRVQLQDAHVQSAWSLSGWTYPEPGHAV